MTTDRGALAALLATMTFPTAALMSMSSPATAQTEQTAPIRGLEGLANPAAPTSAPIPIPATPKIVLPTETSAPRRPPRPRAVEKAATEKAAADTPAKTKAAADRPTARPEAETRPSRAAAEATPSSPATEPVTTPKPEAVAPAVPEHAPSSGIGAQDATLQPQTTSVITPQSTVTAPATGRAMPLWLSLAVIVVVLAGLWWLRRKPRSRRQDVVETETFVEPMPEPVAPASVTSPPFVPAPIVPIPAAPIAAATVVAPKFLEPGGKAQAPPPISTRARLTCELRPLRAGLNLLSATVECELVVANAGDAPAEQIRAGVALLTAHAGQDADLAGFNAVPIARPITPPFALAPGETRTIRTVTAIARDAIRTMTAANRPMFVPVVATNLRYVTSGDEAQTAHAWSIGIERVDSPKLAPFWLDAPPRMYGSVAARPHATEFDS